MLPNILNKICERKREEIARLRRRGEAELRDMIAQSAPKGAPRGFGDALTATDRVSLIAEVKKASPSAGVIRADFDPVAVACAYAEGGARCISVLTDEEFFHGSLSHLRQVREAVSLPLLRKDFILDEIQLLEARAWGADCALLIVAALDAARLSPLLHVARGLGLDALVEAHDERELEAALDAGADMVAINNRDLHTFQVTLETTARLAPRVPPGIVKVSESGVRSRNDVETLKSFGVDAVLVGEYLMGQPDPTAATRELSEV